MRHAEAGLYGGDPIRRITGNIPCKPLTRWAWAIRFLWTSLGIGGRIVLASLSNAVSLPRGLSVQGEEGAVNTRGKICAGNLVRSAAAPAVPRDDPGPAAATGGRLPRREALEGENDGGGDAAALRGDGP